MTKIYVMESCPDCTEVKQRLEQRAVSMAQDARVGNIKRGYNKPHKDVKADLYI